MRGVPCMGITEGGVYGHPFPNFYIYDIYIYGSTCFLEFWKQKKKNAAAVIMVCGSFFGFFFNSIR